MAAMEAILNLEAFPLHQPHSPAYQALVTRCQADLSRHGLFNLEGFLRPQAAQQAVSDIGPSMATDAFTHKRLHNIYFKRDIPGLKADHPALQQCETINHTLCADQLEESLILDVYRFEPLVEFLATVMQKPALYLMADPLAQVNVMAYREDEALNWHFDRSEFTTTLLLQAPEQGGAFEYRTDLRSDDDPNYAGVARLLQGQDPDVQALPLSPGTLNVFRGKNTAHRVTPVQGQRERIIAVFSYFERPGVLFSKEERLGFYGRAK